MAALSRSLCVQIRGLSTSASLGQLVKAPVQVFGVEGRYATALYSAASKEKKLDAVEKELLDFQSLVKSNGMLRDFIMDPTAKRNIKKDVVTAVFQKTKASDLTINMFGAMIDHGRLSKLDAIANSFKTLMSAHRGEVVCEVVTAKALDAGTLKEVEGALKSFLKQGETLLLNTKVDPSLIGGMVVSVGDKFVDMSVASKMKRYTAILNDSV